jgi:hypothetical protein
VDHSQTDNEYIAERITQRPLSARPRGICLELSASSPHRSYAQRAHNVAQSANIVSHRQLNAPHTLGLPADRESITVYKVRFIIFSALMSVWEDFTSSNKWDSFTSGSGVCKSAIASLLSLDVMAVLSIIENYFGRSTDVLERTASCRVAN